MRRVRRSEWTPVAVALAWALSLPAWAQVATTRPQAMPRAPAAAMLAPMRPDPAQARISPEQRQWVAEQIQANANPDLGRLDAAARARFPDASEASLDYLIQYAARLAAGDNQEQLRQMQAQLAALEAQKRALRERTGQKTKDAAGVEAASAEQKQAAQESYLKSRSLRMPSIAMDTTSGSARLSTPGQFTEPASPPDDPGAGLSPSLRAWVKTRARVLVDSGATPDPNLIAGDVRTRLAGQDYGDADVMAIAYLVMMEASKAAQEDLREIMAQAKALNERKATMREAMQAQRAATTQVPATTRAELQAICIDPPCKPQLAAEVSRAADQKDSMSEMGEMESLRLQMAMDRLSKMMSTLSNLLKKQSDTASSITQNLK